MWAAIRQATDGDGPGARTDESLARSVFTPRTLLAIVASTACYYVATRIAWVLCFPDSKVSLFFPPRAILVSILLLVPTRHWWAYTLAAASAHFIATQQVGWPPLFALEAEAFDAVQSVLVAAGIRHFIRSPFHRLTLREAIAFVLVAVVVVPFGTSFWGASFTVAYGFGTDYWVEWRNLGISNGVTAIVLVPAILFGVHLLRDEGIRVVPMRVLEAAILAAALFAVGYLAFDRVPAGPGTSPALLYAPVPLLIWAALRFGLGGKSISMLIVTMLAIWGTMHGRGPFLAQTPAENALALQLFLLMVATPLMLLAVAIGEERRSKEALRVSEARMSLAVESAQISLWDWDVANDRIWMKEEGRKYLAFERGEPLRYSSMDERVHPDDRAMRNAAIAHALATGGTYEAEYRVILPDGSVRWIAGRGRSTGPVAGEPGPRMLGVSIDITREKQVAADAQLQREELAHLSRIATVSTLSGSIAHELSQPLGSMLHNAEAGRRYMQADPPDLGEVREIFEDIITEGRRAGEIIARMRTLLRRGEVSLQPVKVGECLDELLRLTRSDLIARGVAVSKQIADDLPPVRADRVQLQQVLLNLIVNACDAMKANAPGDRMLTLTASVAQDELRIGVLDCGVGLPENVDNLFQPFHTTKDGGLGMGLSICRTLITAHRGRLWAERRVERGAAFYIALPVARELATG